MASNKNIFCVTNPAKITDALIHVIGATDDLSDVLLFLPSRRAVRTVERALVAKIGHAVILPQMIPLGTGPDFSDETPTTTDKNIVSDTSRVIALCRLLASDGYVGTIANALPLARDLIRMTDYLENEGINISDINWNDVIDERFAAHFQHKAKILSLIGRVMPEIFPGCITHAAKRNSDIRKWIDILGNQPCPYRMVIVCASTASVPATSDLMAHIAQMPNGRIILPGKISGRTCDMELSTNPYNSEFKFLNRIGVTPHDVEPIDVGHSAIDFMNTAFGNDVSDYANASDISHVNMIECQTEAAEAATVAEITIRARNENKSVLVITPDAAGNQRIAAAFAARGIVADFSGGIPGTMHNAGRAILNVFDNWIEHGTNEFTRRFSNANGNLFQMLQDMVDSHELNFTPEIDLDDESVVEIFVAIRNLSNAISDLGIKIDIHDARALIMDTLSGISIRGSINDNADVVVLGTIESRMQTADVVILTGLNDGMFPARGYENTWLPRFTAEKIGLPPSDRKVSLMALDFMNLTCGKSVYWTRSRISGGVQTIESRFISRVIARAGMVQTNNEIINAVKNMDCPSPRPLNHSQFTPPADWSDVYVTELEKLIHNPYAFYVSHILRLRPIDDYWVGPDARTFGNLVHDAVKDAPHGATADMIVNIMDSRAHKILGNGGILFHFWHRRFLEIAPIIADELRIFTNARSEISGHVKIAGRNVRARADRVWPDGVMDIKTGSAPNKTQLMSGNMPQLPIEAFILKSGGFPFPRTQTPVMRFLQLKNNDVRVIEYDTETTKMMMNAAFNKVTELFNMYSAGGAAYEYHDTNDAKYHEYDDFARVRD
ncbi:MAG: PD-(D/E)XK nuclease family protein [Alphaproteobacteria bacterium]|nr:PD-(D/E)XK nuclease family protein [Alphaproteobacteria bacterium]